MTAEVGLEHLSTLCSMEMNVKNQGPFLKALRPYEKLRQLVNALDLDTLMLTVLLYRNLLVSTRNKGKRKSDIVLKFQKLEITSMLQFKGKHPF